MSALKCPLCGNDPTCFGESYSDGDDWVEYPFSRQKCFGCELPCKLWKQIETMQQRLAELWKCVELYSKKDNWGCSTLLSEDHDCESEPEKCCWDEWQGPAGVHGYEPAQECWKKVEAMKGGGS